MKIIPANKFREAEWLELRLRLWPKHTRSELKQEIRRILRSGREAAFLAIDVDGNVAGFAEVSVREHVDGCRTRPVGYLEGIYVRPGFRKKGIASQLVRRGESWAAARGCREMGSDTAIDGRQSIAFHRAFGFRITERQVVFLKNIRRRRT